ncbi:MAG: hypothetical protein DHS20C10_06010 [marine bacterium B5-7]|nr:MAG: hypothetical protein DHS20C10_06010 [marine bacterium B5-7]
MENGDDSRNVPQGFFAKLLRKTQKGVADTGKAVEKMQNRRGSTQDEQKGLMAGSPPSAPKGPRKYGT